MCMQSRLASLLFQQGRYQEAVVLVNKCATRLLFLHKHAYFKKYYDIM